MADEGRYSSNQLEGKERYLGTSIGGSLAPHEVVVDLFEGPLEILHLTKNQEICEINQ